MWLAKSKSNDQVSIDSWYFVGLGLVFLLAVLVFTSTVVIAITSSPAGSHLHGLRFLIITNLKLPIRTIFEMCFEIRYFLYPYSTKHDYIWSYLGDVSSKWVFDGELLFYSGVGRCAEGVGVYGVSFDTGGDNSFVAECFRDNNFNCKGFRGNCWSELGDAYLSIYRCVGISAVKLWVSISMGWGMVGMGSKSHRGQEEQEDLK